MHLRRAFALTSLSLLASCGNSSAPEPPPVAKDSAAKTPERPASSAVSHGAKPAAGDLAWDVPASFKQVANPSSMRKATYEATKADGDAEAPTLSVIVAGGGVDANVDRWIGQFDDAAKATVKKETKKVGDYDVTIVSLEGTFAGGGMPGGPAAGSQPGWALLGAVVPVGDQAWFFKMTGPKASVAAARSDFDAMIGSLRAAK